jgi:hypothetical protein
MWIHITYIYIIFMASSSVIKIPVSACAPYDRKTFFVCETIGTAATPGLLCQPRVIMKVIVEKQMESRLPGETEVLGENLPQRHVCPSQNPTWPHPGLNPGRRGGKPATNRLTGKRGNQRTELEDPYCQVTLQIYIELI